MSCHGSLVVVVVEMVVEAGLWVGARRGRRRLDDTGEIVDIAAAGLEGAAQGTHGGEHFAVDIGGQQADQFGQARAHGGGQRPHGAPASLAVPASC